jgi:hypothetical protein
MPKWLRWEDALARKAFEMGSSLWIAFALTRFMKDFANAYAAASPNGQSRVRRLSHQLA